MNRKFLYSAIAMGAFLAALSSIDNALAKEICAGSVIKSTQQSMAGGECDAGIGGHELDRHNEDVNKSVDAGSVPPKAAGGKAYAVAAPATNDDQGEDMGGDLEPAKAIVDKDDPLNQNYVTPTKKGDAAQPRKVGGFAGFFLNIFGDDEESGPRKHTGQNLPKDRDRGSRDGNGAGNHDTGGSGKDPSGV